VKEFGILHGQSLRHVSSERVMTAERKRVEEDSRLKLPLTKQQHRTQAVERPAIAME
jgi:hypothetical protein